MLGVRDDLGTENGHTQSSITSIQDCLRLDKKENKHLDYIREACSGIEGQYLGTLRRNFDAEVADVKPLWPFS